MLRGHRRAARLTLEQLAGRSGVSARTLSDMERGRSKGPQHRTVTALADALALDGDARRQLVELARDGRLRDHWTRPAGRCELPRLVDDFTGRAAELTWVSDLVQAESVPGAGVTGLITGSKGMGETTLVIRAAQLRRPDFPGGVFFPDLLGMSPRPAAAADALRLLLGALGATDEQLPADVPGRASVYRSLLRDRRALVVLDNAGAEEQVRPLLPGDGASRVLITARRPLAGLEGVRRLADEEHRLDQFKAGDLKIATAFWMPWTSSSTSACCMTAPRAGTGSTTWSGCSPARGLRRKNPRPNGRH